MDEDEKYNKKLEAGLYTLQVKDLLHFYFVTCLLLYGHIATSDL